LNLIALDSTYEELQHKITDLKRNKVSLEDQEESVSPMRKITLEEKNLSFLTFLRLELKD